MKCFLVLLLVQLQLLGVTLLVSEFFFPFLFRDQTEIIKIETAKQAVEEYDCTPLYHILNLIIIFPWKVSINTVIPTTLLFNSALC